MPLDAFDTADGNTIKLPAAGKAPWYVNQQWIWVECTVLEYNKQVGCRRQLKYVMDLI